MPANKVENVEVRGMQSGGTFSLSCEYDGARYHVWLDRKTQEVKPPLYKNPPLSLKRDDPGHFDTRKLDLDGATGRKILPAMLAAMHERDLVRLWSEQLAKEEEQRVREAEMGRYEAAVQGAAPELLSALQAYRREIERIQTERGAIGLSPQVQRLGDEVLSRIPTLSFTTGL